MKGKRIAVALLFVVLSMGLLPCIAFAEGGADLKAAPTQLGTQAKRMDQCIIKFTDDDHVCADTDRYQMYFVDGKNAVATPEFDVYLGKKKVSPSKYTVQYVMSWWDDKADKEKSKKVKPSNLKPSNSPSADIHDMSTEYRIVITAKSGSGFSGSFEGAAVVVVDRYNFGRNMDTYLPKAKWQYNINPMNNSYYVIQQSKVKTVLDGLVAKEMSSPGEGGMNHDGKKVAKKYYQVSYYKAKKTAVRGNMSPAVSAKTGKKLSSMPKTPGSYVMVIKGKKPYYGSSSILFDVQGKISESKLKISKIASQTENGKYIEPKLTVKYNGATLKKGVDYDVEFTNNLQAGTATATVTGTKVLTNTQGIVDNVSTPRFFTGSKKLTFKINKNLSKTWTVNPMTASVKAQSVSAQVLRDEGDQTIEAGDAFQVSGAEGAVTFTKVSGPSILEIDKSGNVTVGAHAGFVGEGKTFSMKVKVKAAGSSTVYEKAHVLTLKVSIK